MSGIYWWTTDIGIHTQHSHTELTTYSYLGGYDGGDINDPVWRELIVRWFQFGAFCPLFRLHGYRTPTDGPSQCGGSGGRNEVHIHPHCLICLMLWLIVGVGIWRYCIRHHSWYHASARAAATLCHETRTSQPSPSPLQHATPNSLLILIDEDSGGDRHSCVAADVFRVS